MAIPDWVLDPFSTTDTEECQNLQEKLIELTTNEETKLKKPSANN